jgi:hypothetical protein
MRISHTNGDLPDHVWNELIRFCIPPKPIRPSSHQLPIPQLENCKDNILILLQNILPVDPVVTATTVGIRPANGKYMMQRSANWILFAIALLVPHGLSCSANQDEDQLSNSDAAGSSGTSLGSEGSPATGGSSSGKMGGTAQDGYAGTGGSSPTTGGTGGTSGTGGTGNATTGGTGGTAGTGEVGGAGGSIGGGAGTEGGVTERCNYDLKQDKFQVVTEYETTAKSGWYTDTWATPVTTVGDTIYFTYVGQDLKARVGTIRNGKTEEHILDETHLVTDDGHNEFSIAVDKLGYVHIVGDMHNNELRYWRSNAPNDISGFARHFGGINDGDNFSYYFFRTDRLGELYLVARVRALDVYHRVGGRGVGLFHYATDSKQWTARGSLAPHVDAKLPVIFWEDSGTDGTSYQMYKADVRFDALNRLHFTVTANNENAANTHNYAVYAYSNDGGHSFQTTHGSAALPLRIDSGIGQADLIDGYSNANMEEHSGLFLDYTGNPGVFFSIDGSTWYRHADLSAPTPTFSERISIRTGHCTRCMTLFDKPNGVLTLVDGSTLRRTQDFGQPFTNFNVGVTIKRWDLRALQDQDTYRGVVWNSGNGSFKIVRLAISNSTTCK